jgi:PHP family Zn ribbon phosphoesterase
LKGFKADLHIHTCLSPCADLEMSPRNIVAAARRRDLDILGICDHNSAENAGALVEAARPLGLRVLPGLEITSQEEVHILALFDEVDTALAMQERVYASLPGENDDSVFGQQIIANGEDEVLGFNPKFLAGATTLTLEEVVGFIHVLRGLAVASHVDREGFGLIGQLGFIPDRLDLDALEISHRISLEEGRIKFGSAVPLISSSDAHFLSEIGQATTAFLLEAGTYEEIRLALKGSGGRTIIH